MKNTSIKAMLCLLMALLTPCMALADALTPGIAACELQPGDEEYQAEERGVAACELQPGDAQLLAPSANGSASGADVADEADVSAADETGYSLLFTNNPVPDIAERCLPSVVGVINLVSTFDFTTRKTTEEEYGFGSGVVIDDAGHIITNAHVIEGADKVRILLSDDSELEAEVVGYDNDTDLAVLYVEGLELPPIALGDSDALRVGDLLIAIGNPGGYYGTVSVGVVSALERDIEEFARPMAIIQTDAAMSPGISGGALLNSRGELVGIPSLGVILYEGLNFAIPVNTMKEVAAELIEHGKVRKPGIGIYYTVQDGPDEPLKNYLPAGLLVAEVGVDTPAERGGMRVGDVIYAIEGERVKSGRDLMVAMQGYNAGDEVVFTVYRFSYEDRDLDENFLDITLTLEYIN